MADANLYCKTCGLTTEHMHLTGRECICSVCGEKTMAKNWKQIKADVEERKRGHQAEVAKRNRAVDDTITPPAENTRKRLSEAEVAEIRKRYVELTAGGESRVSAWSILAVDFNVCESTIRAKVSDMPETIPAPAEPIAAQPETEPAAIETKEPQGETKMAKLTAENKADIIRRSGAGEATSVISADFHVSDQTIRNVLNAGGTKKEKKAKKTKSPRGRAGRRPRSPRASRQAAQEPQGEQAGGLKAAIQAMVDIAVEAKLADLGYVKADELDAKVEAALARALK